MDESKSIAMMRKAIPELSRPERNVHRSWYPLNEPAHYMVHWSSCQKCQEIDPNPLARPPALDMYISRDSRTFQFNYDNATYSCSCCTFRVRELVS